MQAVSKGMREHEPQRSPPGVDGVAGVPASELLTVPGDEIIRRDRRDAARSEGRQAVESQACFVAVVGALGEVVDVDAVLLILQPFDLRRRRA